MKDVFECLYTEVCKLESRSGGTTKKSKRGLASEVPYEYSSEYLKWTYVEKPLLTEMLKNIKEARPNKYYSLNNTKEDNLEIDFRYNDFVLTEALKVEKEVKKNGGPSSKFSKILPHFISDITCVIKNHMYLRDLKNNNLKLREYLNLPPKELLETAEKQLLFLNEPFNEKSLNKFKSLERKYFGDSSKGLFRSKEFKKAVKENYNLHGQLKEKLVDIKRQKTLLSEMNERLDKESVDNYGDFSRKPLSAILDSVRCEKANENDQFVNTEGIRDRAELNVEEAALKR